MTTRKKRGQMKKMTRKDKRLRDERDERKPREARHSIRTWAHKHIVGDK